MSDDILRNPPSIIAIGNPGSGKSTMLNALAHELLFKSGISYGSGMSPILEKKTNRYGIFYNTPRLADDTYRKKAAEAISSALGEGRVFKILFFVLTDSGRVVKQDVTTMELVLDACPEMKRNYGIVINKVPKPVAKGLLVEANQEKFAKHLFAGIDDDRKCAPSNIITMLKYDELEVQDGFVADLDKLKDYNGNGLKNFVFNDVPTVQVTVDKANTLTL